MKDVDGKIRSSCFVVVSDSRLSWDILIHDLLPFGWNLLHQIAWFSSLHNQAKIYKQLFRLPSLQTTDHRTSQYHNYVNQSFVINLLYILLVLFLWRAQTNKHTTYVSGRIMNRKNPFPQWVVPGAMEINGQRKYSQRTEPELHKEFPHCQKRKHHNIQFTECNLSWTNDTCILSIISFTKWKY